LAQQLQHLKPIAEAFRAADIRSQGVLGLEQFTVFCMRLNASMSQEEVQALFDEELRAQGHKQVTFSAICRALLPAM
jgi:Ca2+-binding EF-hand superfamily protein